MQAPATFVKDLGTWLGALFASWVRQMCSVVGLGLSLWGWLLIPDASKFRPWVIAAGLCALIMACFLSWREQYQTAQGEIRKNAKPQLAAEVKEVQYSIVLSEEGLKNKPEPLREILLLLDLYISSIGPAPFAIREVNIDIQGGATFQVQPLNAGEYSRLTPGVATNETVVLRVPKWEPLKSFLDNSRTLRRADVQTGWLVYLLRASRDFLLEDLLTTLIIVDNYGNTTPLLIPKALLERASDIQMRNQTFGSTL